MNPFLKYAQSSNEADVNIDIDVNENEADEALDTSDTPEAGELAVADADADAAVDEAASDNVDDAVTSLEGLYYTLQTIASSESSLSDSSQLLLGLHLNQIGMGINATAGNLVPSVESDNYFERADVEASMEAIMDRIKEGTAAIGATVKRMYESVKTTVTALMDQVQRLEKRSGAVQTALNGGNMTEGAVSIGSGKRLAIGKSVGSAADINKGANDLLKFGTQVLTDRKGIQVIAGAAQALSKDGDLSAEKIDAEMKRAYPLLKATADEDGNVPLQIGNTAVFLVQGKNDLLPHLGFKNPKVDVEGHTSVLRAAVKSQIDGYKGAAKGAVSGAKTGYKLGAKATKHAGKAGAAAGAVLGAPVLGGAVIGGTVGVASKVAGRAVGGVGGAYVGSMKGSIKGQVDALKTANTVTADALTASEAKALFATAQKLIEMVKAYRANVEGRAATNEQIVKMLDEAVTSSEGAEKAELKSNAALRRSLGKAWKKTLRVETQVANWALRTAAALLNYVAASVGAPAMAEEADATASEA